MSDLLHALKGHMGAMDQQWAQPSIGVVTSVSDKHLVKVRYEDGELSGWLSVASQAAGGGWGVLHMPKPGEQVLLIPRGGAAGHEVVAGFLHTEATPAPKLRGYMETGDAAPLLPGETGMVHESGAFVRIRDGGVIESAGTWKHQGDVLVSGDIRDRNGQHGTLNELRDAHDEHHHHGVRTGPDLSGLPDRVLP